MFSAFRTFGALGSQRGVFDVVSLFRAGEQGVWYDPSDTTTLFQDSAGTTPVTASGQPVGLMLDKSGRGNHATQPTAASRPIYRDVGGLRYLECDGVDDGMVTGNIDFTGTDKVSVFAGVRKLSDAARAMLLELSAAGSAGSFAINAPVSTGSGFSFVSTGSAPAAIATLATAPSPISAVLSCVGDIAADTCSLFVDGQLAASSSADQGAGNYGNRPLYLFRRGGVSLPFNGWFYGLAITGRLTTDAETAATERFLAAKSAVVIP